MALIVGDLAGFKVCLCIQNMTESALSVSMHPGVDDRNTADS